MHLYILNLCCSFSMFDRVFSPVNLLRKSISLPRVLSRTYYAVIIDLALWANLRTFFLSKWSLDRTSLIHELLLCTFFIGKTQCVFFKLPQEYSIPSPTTSACPFSILITLVFNFSIMSCNQVASAKKSWHEFILRTRLVVLSTLPILSLLPVLV